MCVQTGGRIKDRGSGQVHRVLTEQRQGLVQSNEHSVQERRHIVQERVDDRVDDPQQRHPDPNHAEDAHQQVVQDVPALLVFTNPQHFVVLLQQVDCCLEFVEELLVRALQFSVFEILFLNCLPNLA